VFVTLFTVMATTQSIRLLGDAASGKIASEAVLALLGFSAINYLPVLLSLTVFMAVLLVVSRQYKDSEMVVWFSAGRSLKAWAPTPSPPGAACAARRPMPFCARRWAAPT
jgi:lipopolysaccharide export system permease protein